MGPHRPLGADYPSLSTMSRFRNTNMISRVVHHVELPWMTFRRRKDIQATSRGPRDEVEPTLATKIIPAAAPIKSKREALREVLIPSLGPESGLYKQQVSILERRLAKLNRVLAEQQALLGNAEGEIGIASEFRVVQGLDLGESDLNRKRVMMRTIFEANLELRDSIIS